MLKNKNIYLIPIFGFILVILIGWIILMMPFCNNGNITPLDSLFTAVSATCVNGLTTVCLSKEYTFLGQIVIACITEIGAIGFVTFISLIISIKKKKMQLSETLLLSNALNDNDYNRLKQRLKEVIKYTLIIELIGAICLAVEFIPIFGVRRGIWYSVFHSITAFCNTGFDLFGDSSLMMFANNVYINVVFIILMILGGIGFFVIEDIIRCIKKKSFIHMEFHTKNVLTTSLIIYFLSVVLTKISQPDLTILQVLFMSSTIRTTGFSTINMETTSMSTKVLFSILMMIGGAPGSTSGGIRITSIAILILTVRATLRNKKEVTVFYKKIDIQTIKQAITNIFVCNLIIMIAVVIFANIQNIGLLEMIFMCVSAFSATGFSIVNMSVLKVASKIILILLMFIGRIGPISILSVFILKKKENKNIEYVSGNLML